MDNKIDQNKPLFIQNSTKLSVKKIFSQYKLPKNTLITDTTKIALNELFEVKNPTLKDKFSEKDFVKFLEIEGLNSKEYGDWVYYPWKNQLVKVPPKDDLRLLRTARNQLLITPEEQEILLSKTILIAGMSVGSNVVEQLIHGGIGSRYIIADMDTLEITNLNRIKTGVTSVGLPKVVDVARKIWELDPYLDIVVLEEGVNKEILETVSNKYEIDVFVDEVDDIGAKIEIRNMAKQRSIPVVMATDNSDGAILDIERYDIDKDQEMFNGKIPKEVLQKMQSGEMSREESGQAIGKYFVGMELVDERLVSSLMQVRKTIPSWPQLGTAAGLSGILVAYAVKQILLKANINSNRHVADYDKILSK